MILYFQNRSVWLEIQPPIFDMHFGRFASKLFQRRQIDLRRLLLQYVDIPVRSLMSRSSSCVVKQAFVSNPFENGVAVGLSSKQLLVDKADYSFIFEESQQNVQLILFFEVLKVAVWDTVTRTDVFFYLLDTIYEEKGHLVVQTNGFDVSV